MDAYLKNWLIKAANDLKVAENEFNLPADKIVTDAICFHCQQAVEKFLKAYLISRKKEFGKTHNIELLLEMCIKEDKDFTGLDIGNLSFYAVEIRYPDEFYIPTIKEAAKSIELAKTVKDFVTQKL